MASYARLSFRATLLKIVHVGGNVLAQKDTNYIEDKETEHDYLVSEWALGIV